VEGHGGNVARGTINTDRKQKKRNKLHLLIISETGKVKTRKVSLRFIKWFVGSFIFLLILTSVFTILYLRNLHIHRVIKSASDTFLKESDQLRSKAEKQTVEIKRLQGMIERLSRENQDLKQHIISRKTPSKKGEVPQAGKNLEAYQAFLTQIEGLEINSPAVLRIRDPKIDVSETETVISFNFYKKTLKKMYGRFILIGIYKPEDPQTVGRVVAFPKKGVMNFKIRPGYGQYFKIKRQFLPVKANLSHPEDVSRFSEFHVFVYGMNKKLLFHEKFEAP
jgi:hypothetical protein